MIGGEFAKPVQALLRGVIRGSVVADSEVDVGENPVRLGKIRAVAGTEELGDMFVRDVRSQRPGGNACEHQVLQGGVRQCVGKRGEQCHVPVTSGTQERPFPQAARPLARGRTPGRVLNGRCHSSLARQGDCKDRHGQSGNVTHLVPYASVVTGRSKAVGNAPGPRHSVPCGTDRVGKCRRMIKP